MISTSLGLLLAALPLAALVGPLVWMASHDAPDGGYSSPPMSAASRSEDPLAA